MAGQPTTNASRYYALLLIVPFAALAVFLATYASPAAPNEGGSIYGQLFIYGLIAALITGIWASVSQKRWSGWRFAGTFAVLLTVGIAMMAIGQMGTAKATDPAHEMVDPWIILSE